MVAKSTDLKSKIFKETLIYSIGSFGSKILSFLLVPFYSFFLTKKELGEYDLLITTISLFIPLVSLQLSDATYRWLIDEKNITEKGKAEIITNSLLGYFVSYALFFAGFIIFIQFQEVEYSGYFLALLFFNGLLPFLQNILRGLGEIKKFALNGVITSFFIVIFNVIFIYFFKFKVEGILLANIVAYSIACLLIFKEINIFKYINASYYNFALLKKMLKYAIPLIPNLMSWWLIGSASKYIILHFMGAESNGLYAISSRLPSILVIINSVLVLPIQDGILKKDSKLEDFKELLVNFFKLEFSLILVLIVLSPIFTKYIVSNVFYEAWRYMGFLFIGVGLNTLGAVLGLSYQKKLQTIKITLTSLVGATVSVGLSYVLINYYGLIGLSFAYMLGFFVMFFMRFIDTKNNFKLNINNFQVILMLAVLLAVNYLTLNITYLYQIILALVVLLLVVLINKKNIIYVIRKNR